MPKFIDSTAEAADPVLQRIARAREQEAQALKDFEASMRQERERALAVPRARVGAAIRDALAVGYTKAAIQRSLGTKDFKTLGKYTDLPDITPEHNGTIKVLCEAPNTVTVLALDYRLGDQWWRHSASWTRDEDGEWVADDPENEFAIAVEQVVFYGAEDAELMDAWTEAVLRSE